MMLGRGRCRKADAKNHCGGKRNLGLAEHFRYLLVELCGLPPGMMASHLSRSFSKGCNNSTAIDLKSKPATRVGPTSAFISNRCGASKIRSLVQNPASQIRTELSKDAQPL